MTDTMVHLFTSGAYLPFFMLLAYFGIRYVTDETHWLGGKLGVIAAAVLTAASQLVPILATGKLPDQTLLLGAIMTAVGLYIHPVAKPAA